MDTKVCSACKNEKSRAEFPIKRQTKDGLRATCRDCHNAANEAYRKENPRKRTARPPSEARRKSEKARQLRRRGTRSEYAKAYYAANREKVIQGILLHAKQHPEKFAARTLLRKATQLRATPSWADRRAIAAVYAQAAAMSKQTGQKWHVDHLVPLRSPLVCGLHVEQNLVARLATENIAKSNRHWPDMP